MQADEVHRQTVFLPDGRIRVDGRATANPKRDNIDVRTPGLLESFVRRYAPQSDGFHRSRLHWELDAYSGELTLSWVDQQLPQNVPMVP